MKQPTSKRAAKPTSDSFPLADWDNAAGRTQAERLALVERVLSELGVALVRRGGWSVSGR